ncbi:sodium:alanine symporter family protein [Clostridium sp. D2Q-14]|uniref:alanine/glycine:cation symporter family protein n=1 Tax=Anaeromonas gelatinilytica TaxID=2683194 RepID=UPI00193C4793|nr:sodium:alanine symporter family protein [Anaeromonas gelatinilytica]MBS4536407.1 sodium:alanine symporter family protein [Anaeromonas gelatinilytica]
MESLMKQLEAINQVLWGPVMLIVLLGTGVLFTLRLRFIQIRKLKEMFKQIFSRPTKEREELGLSSFQSLSTAIAGQVGTGNLAGVATAIVAGGPGSIFWMWISGFFGMGTIFAEAVLGQLFNKNKNGELVGGPAYYLRYGLKSKMLAAFFAISIVFALGFMGNMVQSNSIALAVNNAFNIPKIIIGVIVAALAGLILIGGVKRIGAFTEKIVPFMAALYILGGIAILVINHENILPALKMIFYGAFNPKAATGGLIGATVKETLRYGIARGLFSNEAGMGSTPHAHAVAKVDHPVQQGLVSMLGVIIDTGIVCTITALVILTTGAFETGLTSSELTQQGFRLGFSNFGNFGLYFIAVALFFFAFSTIIGWYFFGELNIKYLFGKGGVKYYRYLVLLCIVLGTLLEVDLVWALADVFNALMIIPNLIALVGLSNLVVKSVKEYSFKEEKEENVSKTS